MMSEELCIFCTKFQMAYEDEHAISESTWQSGSMTGYCEPKGSVNFYDEDDYRKIILRAGTCEDYEQVKTTAIKGKDDE